MLNRNFLMTLLFAGLTAMTFVACDNDDDTPVDPNADKTVAQIAADDGQFSTLVSALDRVGLTSTLDDENASFTVFAPTDAAFNALGIDLSTLSDAELTEILLYHVLGAEVQSKDLPEGKTYATTATSTGPGGTQLSILIEKTAAGAVSLNGDVNVTTADVVGKNGVIHVIDAVLLPLDLVGHATANDDFSQLVTALGGATGDLVNALSADGPFTVFAPVNSAFEAIAGTVSGLNADQLATVLTYHVVANANVRSSTLTDGMSVTSLNGETFTVNISGSTVTITDAQGNTADVLLTDVQTTNGVIHVLGSVLLPENI